MASFLFPEPNFVSSYEIGDFIYFFFRETAVEFINCGKVRQSNIVIFSQIFSRENWLACGTQNFVE